MENKSFERVSPFNPSHTYVLSWYDGPIESICDIDVGMLLMITLSTTPTINEDLCIPMSYKDFFLYSNGLLSYLDVVAKTEYLYNQVQLFRDVSKSVPKNSKPQEQYILLDYYAEKYETKDYLNKYPEYFSDEDRCFEVNYGWSDKEHVLFNKLLSKIEAEYITEGIELLPNKSTTLKI